MTLSLAPIKNTHADGSFTHTLRAQLKNWPTDVFHDTPFTVEIYSCDVQTHYATTVSSTDLPQTENITPGSNGLIEFIYTAAKPAVVFAFAFDSIQTL